MDNARIWLAWELVFEATEPVTVSWVLDGPGGSRSRSFEGAATEHRLPVLGLRAASDYTLELTVADPDGHSAVRTLTWTTEALPDDLPRIEVLVHDPAHTEPGYTLLDVKSDQPCWIGVLDEALEWVWLMRPPLCPGDTRIEPDGTLWALSQGNAFQYDLLGEQHFATDWTSDSFPLSIGLHHEVFPLGDSFLALSAQSVEVEAFPVSEQTPGELAPATVQADLVVELGIDGSLRGSWSLAEVLDTSRIGWDSRTPGVGGLEWSHANGVIEDPRDGGLIVSVRHQDAVVKLDRSGQLKWILGNHDGWTAPWTDALLTPVGAVQWPSHQHAPQLTDEGLLVLFDNGNYGDTPYAPLSPSPPVSRAVGYRIDEQAMTVEQVFAYDQTATGPEYSMAQGDADWLPLTGNVLATYGLMTGEAGDVHEDVGRGTRAVRLVEFGPGGEPVLDLRFWSTAEESTFGWKSYRAQRLPDLYGWSEAR